jgi:hypothetical protein
MKIVHSYFTEGYYDWARLFVESLAKTNKKKYKLILSSRNLDKNRQEQLKKLYKGDIEVINQNLDYKTLAKRAEIPLDTLMQYKTETENVKINKYNWVWKLMISAEDRIREIKRVAYSLNKGDLMLNLDIDSYIRKSLDPWFDIIDNHDFTSIIKYDQQMKKFGYIKKKAYVIICCIQGYKIGDPSLLFLDRWMYYIERVSPKYRARGFGQITCYEAYDYLKDMLYWGIIPPNTYSLSGQGDNCILWGANKGAKHENLARFRADFNRK